MSKVVTPRPTANIAPEKRPEVFSDWYNSIVIQAQLADYTPVRGCMVIRPYGFAIWENMRDVLDKRFKATGHVNAAFPLLIPKSFLSREASHIEGFAKECAVVTHYRLKNDPNGSGVIVDPEAKLEEELIIRPTSETIIWHTYKNWIQSYRDLPLLINQWANVMRWEMRTRLFLRTSEFFWQEGHTAHSTAQEAIAETRLMLDEYANFMENYLAMPVIKGVKTANERFAGAVDTYTVEAIMQNGWALQMGTSHFLGQNFAKAFDVTFLNKEGQQEFVWATSWGVSTRMMGGLIMTHSDDEGLVVPPKIAALHVVVIPIINKHTLDKLPQIEAVANQIRAEMGDNFVVKYDGDDSKTSGFKFAEYELRGVPLRIAIGARDLENNQVEVSRRDTREKFSLPLDNIGAKLRELLDDIQQNLYNRALAHREAMTTSVDLWDEFKEVLETKGGFLYAHWDGTSETEEQIKEATRATIRCIPLDNPQEAGTCVFSGKPSVQRVLFARAF